MKDRLVIYIVVFCWVYIEFLENSLYFNIEIRLFNLYVKWNLWWFVIECFKKLIILKELDLYEVSLNLGYCKYEYCD